MPRLSRRSERDGRAFHHQRPFVGLVDARQDLDQRRLPCAVVAEDAGHLAGIHVQRDVVERGDVAEVLRDVLELEQVGRHRAFSAPRRTAVWNLRAGRGPPPGKKWPMWEPQPGWRTPFGAMPIITAPTAAPPRGRWPPVKRQPPTTAAMMNSNSRPTPSLLCMPLRLIAVMIPQKAATVDVAMKSRIFVRATGTPTLRAATGSPPALKIQLPRRVRASTQAATTVRPSHHMVATLSPYFGHTVDAKILCANEKPEAWSMSSIETPPVILVVSPASIPRSMKNVPSVTMKLGSFVFTTVNPFRKPMPTPKSRQTSAAGQRPQW